MDRPLRRAPLAISWIAAGSLAAAPLGGCRLIDQRSFESGGAAPSSAALARSADLAAGLGMASSARPLARVYPDDPGHDWKPDVLAAVRDALVRDPDASFDVVTPIPTARSPERQREAVAIGAADAAAVAGVIEADGVAADHISLAARGDDGDPPREVMVFLRPRPAG